MRVNISSDSALSHRRWWPGRVSLVLWMAWPLRLRIKNLALALHRLFVLIHAVWQVIIGGA